MLTTYMIRIYRYEHKKKGISQSHEYIRNYIRKSEIIIYNLCSINWMLTIKPLYKNLSFNKKVNLSHTQIYVTTLPYT